MYDPYNDEWALLPAWKREIAGVVQEEADRVGIDVRTVLYALTPAGKAARDALIGRLQMRGMTRGAIERYFGWSPGTVGGPSETAVAVPAKRPSGTYRVALLVDPSTPPPRVRSSRLVAQSEPEPVPSPPVKRRGGFAGMTPEQRREYGRVGGKKAHAMGRGHEFTREEARIAGAKGNEVWAKKRSSTGETA